MDENDYVAKAIVAMREADAKAQLAITAYLTGRFQEYMEAENARIKQQLSQQYTDLFRSVYGEPKQSAKSPD